MKRTLTLATGLAVGYVAGTRAGREKYELIRDKVNQVGQQPAVAGMRDYVQEQVGTATKAVTEAASGLSQKMNSSSGDSTSATSGTSATGTSATSGPQHAAKSAKNTPGEYPVVVTDSVPGSGAV